MVKIHLKKTGTELFSRGYKGTLADSTLIKDNGDINSVPNRYCERPKHQTCSLLFSGVTMLDSNRLNFSTFLTVVNWIERVSIFFCRLISVVW